MLMMILLVVLGDTESNIQNATLESIQGQFTYSELLKITNNFERILGKGGIGIVFRGNIDDTSSSSEDPALSFICSKVSAISIRGYETVTLIKYL
jgi:hypothetical protein